MGNPLTDCTHRAEMNDPEACGRCGIEKRRGFGRKPEAPDSGCHPPPTLPGRRRVVVRQAQASAVWVEVRRVAFTLPAYAIGVAAATAMGSARKRTRPREGWQVSMRAGQR